MLPFTDFNTLVTGLHSGDKTSERTIQNLFCFSLTFMIICNCSFVKSFKGYKKSILDLIVVVILKEFQVIILQSYPMPKG